MAREAPEEIAQVGPPRTTVPFMPDLSARPIEAIAAILFAVAVVHTFSTRQFERLARARPRFARLWHLLAEVEIVFALWGAVMLACLLALDGAGAASAYVATLDFTEPAFVFAIMLVAATRPVLGLAESLVRGAARALPFERGAASTFVVLSLAPLLGSLVTEPAAMTLAALMLRDTLFARPVRAALRYATLAVLFVNVSIGGTLTPFAAPPVLMVAGPWGWDFAFMIANFGWKAAIAVVVNAGLLVLVFRRELAHAGAADVPSGGRAPAWLTAAHVGCLVALVIFAHEPRVFAPLLAAFAGLVAVTRRHQQRLILREAALVACFLGGLVVLGGQQAWWLRPLLLALDEHHVFVGATLLTAITDNAALTYLGSLVDGLAPEFKIALVAGAVTGGGLTVIANAPNPAGVAILREKFDDAAISPLALLAAALLPTAVAAIAFRAL